VGAVADPEFMGDLAVDEKGVEGAVALGEKVVIAALVS